MPPLGDHVGKVGPTRHFKKPGCRPPGGKICRAGQACPRAAEALGRCPPGALHARHRPLRPPQALHAAAPCPLRSPRSLHSAVPRIPPDPPRCHPLRSQQVTLPSLGKRCQGYHYLRVTDGNSGGGLGMPFSLFITTSGRSPALGAVPWEGQWGPLGVSFSLGSARKGPQPEARWCLQAGGPPRSLFGPLHFL